MLVKTLEIGWHESKPIYSCDLQKGSPGKVQGTAPYRFATAGADSHVRLWLIHTADPNAAAGVKASPKAEYLATLSKHIKAVNVVRWRHDGEALASAGDDGMLIVWMKDEKSQSVWNKDPNDTGLDKESWKVAHNIPVTSGEVYDVAWSPTGEYILTGSTDNVTRIFSMTDNTCVKTIMEHDHYVQGVAWDPMNQFIATQSADRSVKIYSLSMSNGKLDTQSLRSNTHINLRRVKRYGQEETLSNIAQDAPMLEDSSVK